MLLLLCLPGGARAAALSRPWFSSSFSLCPSLSLQLPAPRAAWTWAPPQPLFGTPASQPKKEPPGYEEAREPAAQAAGKGVARGLWGGWSQSPGLMGGGLQKALERGCWGRRGWAVGAWAHAWGP